MSGVGFFSKSINPYPAIPIRYRLPEIVHFKATEILSTDLIFVREWYRETGKVRRRGKLPVWLTTSGFWMVTSGGSVLNKALKRIAQWCKYQIQIRGNNFLKVKHFDSETAIFMIIQVILKIKNININRPQKTHPKKLRRRTVKIHKKLTKADQVRPTSPAFNQVCIKSSAHEILDLVCLWSN